MKYYAILVAGGSGSRMNAALPKQFLLLNGKPVLMHAIQAFAGSDYCPQIIVVLPSNLHGYWADCCSNHSFNIPHQVVSSGPTRFESVKNGLNKIQEESVIAIHDAVRPVISNHIISKSFQVAEEKGNAIVAIKSRDSVRHGMGDASHALNRDNVYLIQTPQTFRADIIKKGYQQAFTKEFTDDATVIEKIGIKVNLIEGSSKNIKITFPEDIFIAEYFLSK